MEKQGSLRYYRKADKIWRGLGRPMHSPSREGRVVVVEINRDFVIVTDSETRGSFQVFSSLETMIGNLRIGEWISASELIFNLPSGLNNGYELCIIIIIIINL